MSTSTRQTYSPAFPAAWLMFSTAAGRNVQQDGILGCVTLARRFVR